MQDALTRDNIDSDHELLYVARYLLQLTKVPDVTHDRRKRGSETEFTPA
jgi:hypothetical protein